KLEKKSKEITLLKKQTSNHAEITQSLLTTFDLNKLLALILENLTKGFNLDNAYIYNLEGSETTGILRCVATPGVISLKGIDRLTISFLEEEEIISLTLKNHLPLVIEEAGKDKRCSPGLLKLLRLEQMLLQTLYAHGKILGLVIAGNNQKKENLTPEEVERFSTIVNQAGIALENAQFYEKIQELTLHDELTGAYNYRYFYPKLREEMRLASRYRQPLSLAIIDLDDFKRYNDTNGHLAGDSALKQITQILVNRLRKTDVVARYGGEEFAVILPVTNREGAKKILEDLRKEIENYPFSGQETSKNLTISAGISTYPYDAREARELVEAADKGLYQAKNKGKNQICVYSQTSP
ncbi:MAG TPA: hypothetical protein DHV62_06100, partial [Elusimicrobia bacterium]|nr:hypothetical protein [Elusimicrobiota bacterium]